ncbi:MAG: hypothetical protein BYD32DRAFT_426760 [Podila humilis]|nr:MAG: hypothetical protein BYD32DRAFT_426760 [Podila humilis]
MIHSHYLLVTSSWVSCSLLFFICKETDEGKNEEGAVGGMGNNGPPSVFLHARPRLGTRCVCGWTVGILCSLDLKIPCSFQRAHNLNHNYTGQKKYASFMLSEAQVQI